MAGQSNRPQVAGGWELTREVFRRANFSSTDAHAFTSFALLILLSDPSVGFRESLVKLRVRFPLEHLFDEGVVRIATGDTLWCVQVVFTVHLHASDFFNLGQ